MLRMAKRQSTDQGPNAQFQPSAHLGVDMTKTQQKLYNPTAQYYSLRALILEAGGDGARQKLPQRRLNALAAIGAHSMVANGKERLKEMEVVSKLAISLAHISREQKKQTEKKKADKAAKAAATAQKKAASELVRIQEQQTLKEVQAPKSLLKLAQGKSLKKVDYQAIAEVWFPLEPAVPGKLRFPNSGMSVSGAGGMKEVFNNYMATAAGQQHKASLAALLTEADPAPADADADAAAVPATTPEPADPDRDPDARAPAQADARAAVQAEPPVSTHVWVFWPAERTWFRGEVVRFDGGDGTHEVLYEDGDALWHDLRDMKWVLAAAGADAPAIPAAAAGANGDQESPPAVVGEKRARVGSGGAAAVAKKKPKKKKKKKKVPEKVVTAKPTGRPLRLHRVPERFRTKESVAGPAATKSRKRKQDAPPNGTGKQGKQGKRGRH